MRIKLVGATSETHGKETNDKKSQKGTKNNPRLLIIKIPPDNETLWG